MKKLRLSRRGKLILMLVVLIIIIIWLGIKLLSTTSEPTCDNKQVDSTYTQEATITDREYNELLDSNNSFDGEFDPKAGLNYLEELIFTTPTKTLYGVDTTGLYIVKGKIESGETFSKLLNDRFNVNIAIINELAIKCANDTIFDMRNIRVGNSYTAILENDTTLRYLVYEKNAFEYVVFETSGAMSISKGKREIRTKECYADGVINSSLYATIEEEGLSPLLANRLDEIFKWSIDFFSIQPGDSFRVIYEEEYIGKRRVGIGRVFGAEFNHRGVPYLAISFTQGDEEGYWDGEGKNLRKNFLQTPLSFSARVSSSYGTRIHPIQGYRKQHNGIDYAAPSGTPVHAVADGTVTARYYEKGGGNVLKIKHSHGLETLYLHLSRFASGISVGSRVKQNQVVAYSGNTGMSTGPHLHYGVKQNGKYINPTKVPSTPTTPINSANKERFEQMKGDVISAMSEYSGNKK